MLYNYFFFFCFFSDQNFTVCPKNHKRCSKEKGHAGPCNRLRKLHQFHKSSPILLNAQRNHLKQEILSSEEQLQLCRQDLGICLCLICFTIVSANTKRTIIRWRVKWIVEYLLSLIEHKTGTLYFCLSIPSKRQTRIIWEVLRVKNWNRFVLISFFPVYECFSSVFNIFCDQFDKYLQSY